MVNKYREYIANGIKVIGYTSYKSRYEWIIEW
jgi:hypothetical protein